MHSDEIECGQTVALSDGSHAVVSATPFQPMEWPEHVSVDRENPHNRMVWSGERVIVPTRTLKLIAEAPRDRYFWTQGRG